MKFRNHDLAAERSRAGDNLQELLSGVEDLLRSTASHTGDEIEGARSRLRGQLEQVRDQARDWERHARRRTRRAARHADHYVHENAWKTVGVAALIGVLLGCLSVASVSRR